MALGKFSDTNLMTSSAIAGGAWSVALPLANLVSEGRYKSAPARQLTPATLANSLFEVTLARARAIDLIGVLFHTLSSDALYRLTVAGAGGTLAAPALQTAWLPVSSRLFPSATLDWEEPNWWTGQAAPEDLALYPRHLWIPVTPKLIASAIRLEFDDRANPAGFFDIGGVWVAAGWSPVFNFDRGREVGVEPRDVVDEAPSGREFTEDREARRTVAVTWSGLNDREAYRLLDAAARARAGGTVLFAPDLDDPIGLVREAFPARFAAPPRPRFVREHQNLASATLREIIA